MDDVSPVVKTAIRQLLGANYGWREILRGIGIVAMEERMSGCYDDNACEMFYDIQNVMSALQFGEEDHCTPMLIHWTVNQLDERR